MVGKSENKKEAKIVEGDHGERYRVVDEINGMYLVQRIPEEAEIEAERQEMLVPVDDGYKFHDYTVEKRGKLHELLEKDGAKEHMEDDGTYILSDFSQGQYNRVLDAIKFQLKMRED